MPPAMALVMPMSISPFAKRRIGFREANDLSSRTDRRPRIIRSELPGPHQGRGIPTPNFSTIASTSLPAPAMVQ